MHTNEESNKYFVCLQGCPLTPIPWNIPNTDESFNVDCVYFGKVFQTVEEKLNIKGLIFYLTWDVNQLPSYGQNVVAVVLGDEWCRIPKYFHQVRAVFKSYGIYPTVSSKFWLNPSYLNSMILFQNIKNWFLRLPSLFYFKFYKLKNFVYNENKSLHIFDIPLGYYNQLDLPIKDIKTRSYDVVFAGSIAFKSYSFWSPRRWFQTPKIITRKCMISSLQAIQEKYPSLKVQLSLTSSFGYQGSREVAAKSYSEQLMDAKICLVPRGSSLETFRFFEALRYGCIVVAESLPSRWFYNGSPAIQVVHWSELDKIIDTLSQNVELMQKIHHNSLIWWQEKCSESAVGSYIAEQLNFISSPSEIATNKRFGST
ncbi:hypothetical protein [Calothrix sp. 336/3]|uniref:hypothetical protein n=1 Tax=Calothrix sp. 336/3 TaxID=1337936 RepID=UPI0006247125|nr:hypothetical protein [Calothrix sp. 336/3]AKG20945.1 hypothetical protein IJ00_06215 [Calothrix sp. 336/3]